MRRASRRILSGAARFVRSLHPKSILWEYRYAKGPSRPVITNLGSGGRLKVRIHSRDVIAKEIFRYGVFEKAEVLLITKLLKPGMVFFDIGANLGQYTVLAADKVEPGGKVHSFEPNGRMFGELQFNVHLNDLDDCCVLNNVAVSDYEGTGRLSEYGHGSEVYGSLGKSAFPGNQVSGYADVSTTTIDSYLARHSIGSVDVIKLDIEGAELPALRGGSSLWSRDKAPLVVIEMADINTRGFDYKAIEIWDYLESFGYQWYSFNHKGSLSKANRPADFHLGRNLFAAKGGL